MVAISFVLAVLVGSVVLLIAHAVRLSRRATSDAVSSLAQYGYGAETAPLTTQRNARRAEGNLALERTLARVAGRLSPADYEQRLRLRLLQAGLYTFRPSRFLMIRLLAALTLGALGLLYAGGVANPVMKLAALFGAPFLGFMLPDTMLSMRIKGRHRQIERASADLIDLLAITVQAGLGLDQALKVAAERLEGPLAQETRLMLNEIRVGQGRQDALKRLAERADTPTVRSFARTMAQSESMGVPIGQTLKALAQDARLRKRQYAEERAQKAPIHMVFPLATCFFPAILIVAGGPGIIALTKALAVG